MIRIDEKALNAAMISMRIAMQDLERAIIRLTNFESRSWVDDLGKIRELIETAHGELIDGQFVEKPLPPDKGHSYECKDGRCSC